MVLDGILVRKVVVESADLISRRLTQIYQIDKGGFSLRFSDSLFGVFLTPPYVYISVEQWKERSTADSHGSHMLTLMRQKLRNLILRDIQQVGLDRVIAMVFSGADQFGEVRGYHLYIELLGPNSNMVMTASDGTIVHVLRERVTQERTLLPGAKYSLPKTSKHSLEDLNEAEVREISKKCIGNPERELPLMLQGFSRRLSERIVCLASSSQTLKEESPETHSDVIADYLILIKQYLASPMVWVHENADSFSADPAPFEAINKEYYCMPISEALHRQVLKKKNEDLLVAKRKVLMSPIRSELKRLNRLFDRIDEELSQIKDSHNYRKMGELLVANLYRLKDRISQAELEDWETGRKLKIRLDETLTPSENAQLFFKYYEKAKRKKKHLSKRLKHVENERAYIQRLQEMLELAETDDELAQVRQEAIDYGLIRERSSRKITRLSGPREFSYAGHRFLVGKNNLQNDELSRNAAREDIWFHARGTPGSHVILKSAGKKPSEDALVFGARLAARFSKARFSSNVPVDYTQCRDVWKPKGVRPGFVLYRNEQTLFVDPLSEYEQEEST